MRIKLGAVEIDKELWARCKQHGYTREDVRQVIVQNGEESLQSALDTTTFCSKCKVVGTQSTSGSCEHEWVQE